MSQEDAMTQRMVASPESPFMLPDMASSERPEDGQTERRFFFGFGRANPDAPGGHEVVGLVEHLTEQALKGDVEAKFQLAVLYQQGRVVAQNPEHALFWLQNAASDGHVKAMHNLGVTHAEGIGVPVNKEEAAKWYHAAAAEGDPRSYYNLGSLYLEGAGVEKDGEKATMHWFEAALRGMSLAQVRLALAFARGDAGRTDLQLAFIWAYVSQDKEPQSKIILEAISQTLTSEEIAEFIRQADELATQLEGIRPDEKRRLSQEP